MSNVGVELFEVDEGQRLTHTDINDDANTAYTNQVQAIIQSITKAYPQTPSS